MERSVPADAEIMLMPAGTPHSAAFAPDGTLLAVGAGTGVQLIDTGTWTSVRILRGRGAVVTRLAFSPDGALLAAAGGREPGRTTVRVWDTAAGRPGISVAVPVGGETDMTFSPDGAAIRFGGFPEVAIDAHTGQRLDRPGRYRFSAGPVAVSPDGTSAAFTAEETDDLGESAKDDVMASYIVATSGHGETERWRARNATWTGRDPHPHRHARLLRYSPDGSVIASASGDTAVSGHGEQAVRIWDAATGALRATLAEEAYAVAFSADGARIAILGLRRASVWDIAAARRIAVLVDDRDAASDHWWPAGISFSPDGSLVATAQADTVRVWDAVTGAQRASLGGYLPELLAVAVSPDGTRIATAGSDGTARIWDAVTGTQRATLSGHHGEVTAIAFSSDGAAVVTAGHDDTARTWDAATGAQRLTLSGRVGRPGSIACFPDGAVAIAGWWGIQVWDAATGRERLTRKEIGGSWVPHWVMCSPAGEMLAAGTVGEGQAVGIWDAQSGKRRATLGGNGWQVTAVVLSPDGRHLAVAARDARIWKMPGGIAAGALPTLRRRPAVTLTGQQGDVTATAFSPDGDLVAAGTQDCTVRVWDAVTGRELSALIGHDAPVNGIAFLPGGRLVTASADGTARIWDTATGTAIATLAGLPGGGYATMLPGGAYQVADSLGSVWWAAGLRRFPPGELDPHLPGVRRLADGERIG
jgi:WD40 repeat protein